MPVSSSRLSYSDCFTLFEKALDDAKGSRFQPKASSGTNNYGDCYHFRLRMHQARAIDRKDNRELFEKGDPLFGRSVYDPLKIQIKGPDTEGMHWIYVIHTEIDVNDIESLSELEAEYYELPQVENQTILTLEPAQDVLQITDQSIRRRV